MRPFRKPIKQPTPPPPPYDAHEAFIAQYAPAYANAMLARRLAAAAPPTPKPTKALPNVGTYARIGPSTKKDDQTVNNDQIRQQQAEIHQTFMRLPSHTPVTHPYTGKPTTVAEALQDMMKGPGANVHIPSSKTPQAGGSNLQISQSAINQLSERDYKELEDTGGIEGLTKPVETAHITTRFREGALRSHAVRDEKTGEITIGLPTPEGDR